MTKKNLDKIFQITKEYNLGSINAWPLHLRGKTKSLFYSFLRKYFPELLSQYKILYQNGNTSSKYQFKLINKINDLRNKYQLYSVYTPTQVKNKKSTQLTLFE